MSLSDFQVFLQQRLSLFDETLDVTPGSPVDTVVIQPVLRRLGTDPFTVDFSLFAQDRLQQEFPDLATKEGDGIVDLLIKPATLLLDPLVRENLRVRNAQSFQDPSILTTDEASALGANLFATIRTGDTARGVGRIYFAQPQQASVSPANFATSRGGLRFFPTSVQAIRADEMLFNQEGSLYYFDVNLVAEQAGEQYNIGADELVSIANLAAAVRLTNQRRFRFGAPAETAEDFVGRAEQGLTERSLVSERGVRAQIPSAFSEVTQVGVVGFNDPEMQRDILQGGGLGPIVAAGSLGRALADGEGKVTTRRFSFESPDTADFTSLLGPVGPIQGVTLTLHGAFGTSLPPVRDLRVRAVVAPNTLDLEEQVLNPAALTLPWALRRQTLTLSKIPGGILFPDGPNGTVQTPADQIHIGGATDFYVRGTDADAATLVLDDLVGDTPLLRGVELEVTDGIGHVALNDLVLETTYSTDDATYATLAAAYARNYALQVEDGPAAGTYNVIGVTQAGGFAPVLLLDPTPTNPPGNFRWRLIGGLDLDLVEPKATRLAGPDLETLQGSAVVSTAAGLDLQDYGVGQGDILRIFQGPDAGDFVVVQVQSPLTDHVEVDRPLTATQSGLRYAIFRPNQEGGVRLPLVRITGITLLDSSGQPTGSTVPYARPVDIRSTAFANVAHGVKFDLTDVTLGVVSSKFPSGANVSGKSMSVVAGPTTYTITFTGGNPVAVDTIVSQINTQAGTRLAVKVDGDRVGILPLHDALYVQPVALDAAEVLFGNTEKRTVQDVRSATVTAAYPTAWAGISPAVDPNYDVVQVLDGFQIGAYDTLAPAPGTSKALLAAHAVFAPEAARHAQMGSRSLGTVRLFFLEPTSIEFGPESRFAATLADGQVLRFLTDRTLSTLKIPAPPSDPVPKDGSTSGSVLTSAGANFFRAGIQPGDLLTLTYVPITGTVALADPPHQQAAPTLGLVNRTLVLSVGGGPDKTIIFVNDSASLAAHEVSRMGVVDQINRALGRKICSLTPGNQIEFEADFDFILRGTGTVNPDLGIPLSDTPNRHAVNSNLNGTPYVVTAVTATTLTVSNAPGGSFSVAIRQHYQVTRPRLQRTVATVMATQVETAGLYYCDAELISEGTGDRYNIAADVAMVAEGYVSDGYYLTTDDANLTFSTAERPKLHFSRSILEVGVSDSLVNVTQLSAQNVQVEYEHSTLVASVQDFVMADTERVVNQSPLARHLIPYFVRFDAAYAGGSREDVVVPEVESLIRDLAPSDALTVSAIEKVFQDRGAFSVDNPIDLVAVVHHVDRTVTVERSQDRLNTGRLAAFIPDLLNITRKLA